LGGKGGEMLEEMKRLLRENRLCVLATVSKGRPHCSLMGYATDDDCREIYMVTLKDTRKYRNLKENPWVSLLVDTRLSDEETMAGRGKALTVEGVFREVTEAKERERVLKRFLEANPHMGSFIAHHDAEPIVIRVSSLLLLEGPTESSFLELE